MEEAANLKRELEERPFASEELERQVSAFFMTQTTLQLAQAMLLFKHPCFAKEREWRLTRISGPADLQKDLQFRPVRNKLVPYVTLDFDPGLIQEILIAPNAKDMCHFAEYSYRQFIEHHLPDVKVEVSSEALDPEEV
jgi:hypothetical protein